MLPCIYYINHIMLLGPLIDMMLTEMGLSLLMISEPHSSHRAGSLQTVNLKNGLDLVTAAEVEA